MMDGSAALTILMVVMMIVMMGGMLLGAGLWLVRRARRQRGR